VRLGLVKRIPSPGGLGGGSSDAAAVLRGLAARFPGALDTAGLAELALSLGADVPFFLGPEGAGPVPARVTGIGERVEPEPGVPSLALALVHPGPSLETARVYAEFDALAGSAGSLTGLGRAPTMPALSEPAGPMDPSPPGGRRSSGRWASPEWLSQLLANDLEPAARRLCPAIIGVRDALAASGAWAVGLSGSGPTVFGIFPGAPAASKALEGDALRHLAEGPEGPRGWRGVARTMASPGPG
jgi:4-diphosphocytidyl-2-C-methyl-D-erythritol kinase